MTDPRILYHEDKEWVLKAERDSILIEKCEIRFNLEMEINKLRAELESQSAFYKPYVVYKAENIALKLKLSTQSQASTRLLNDFEFMLKKLILDLGNFNGRELMVSSIEAYKKTTHVE